MSMDKRRKALEDEYFARQDKAKLTKKEEVTLKLLEYPKDSEGNYDYNQPANWQKLVRYTQVCMAVIGLSLIGLGLWIL